MSLRRRLLLLTTAVLALGLAALLVGGNLLYARTTAASERVLLETRLEAQVAALSLSPTGVRIRNTINDEALDARGWVFDHGRLIERPLGSSPALDRLAATLARQPGPATLMGPDQIRLISRPLRDGHRRVGTVVVSAAVASFAHLRRVVLTGSALITVIVLALGVLVLRRGLRAALAPVERMTASAEEWDANELDIRFRLGPARDEITSLAHTLDHLLDRIAASRRHEQRFSSEMAHELRTPLAAVRGYAEYGLDPRSGDAERHEALERILDATLRMSQTIDALMAFARHETEAPAQGCDLVALCRELEEPLERPAQHAPLADAEPALVRQALMPILDNAHRHAARRVWIEIDQDEVCVWLDVCDDGPGVDAGLGERAFEPGVRGTGSDDGAGLGLPLARRLARALGGELRLLAGHPTRFRLTLPIRSPAPASSAREAFAHPD